MISVLIAALLFCWWVSGSWYAWCCAFAPLPLLAVAIAADAGYSGRGLAIGLALVAIGWLVTGLPRLLRLHGWRVRAAIPGALWRPLRD